MNNQRWQAVRRLANWGGRDPYECLGITPQASQEEVKTAYYRLSKQYHPDLNSESAAAQRFRSIAAAYGLLADQQARRDYDIGKYAKDQRLTMKEYAKRLCQGRPSGDELDDWIKKQYNKSFKWKNTMNNIIQEKERDENENSRNMMTFVLVILLVGLGTLFANTRPRPPNSSESQHSKSH